MHLSAKLSNAWRPVESIAVMLRNLRIRIGKARQSICDFFDLSVAPNRKGP